MSDDTFFGSLPTGRRLEEPTRPANYAGELKPLRDATPQLVEVAKRHFTEAKRSDFEVTGKEWIDKRSGERYRIAMFDPLQASDPKASRVSTFVVDGPKLVFLRRMHGEEGHRVVLGEVGAREVTGREPLGMPPPEVY
jgi:hypothetical protein